MVFGYSERIGKDYTLCVLQDELGEQNQYHGHQEARFEPQFISIKVLLHLEPTEDYSCGINIHSSL